MASSSMLSLVVVFAVAGTLLSTGHALDGCRPGVDALIKHCKEYVEKEGPPVAPSKQCCNAVRNVDIPCACKYVTPVVEEIISMDKMVYVAKHCGRPLMPGSKCGSYTVPKAWSPS